jgi:hypothetical protein
MSDYFVGVSDELSDEQLEFVALVVGSSWKARLDHAFPTRNFTLQVRGDEIWICEPPPTEDAAT